MAAYTNHQMKRVYEVRERLGSGSISSKFAVYTTLEDATIIRDSKNEITPLLENKQPVFFIVELIRIVH